MFVAVVNAQHEPHVPWSLTGFTTLRSTQLKEDGNDERIGGDTEWKEGAEVVVNKGV